MQSKKTGKVNIGTVPVGAIQRPLFVAALCLATSGASAQIRWVNASGGLTSASSNWFNFQAPNGNSGSQDVHINSSTFPVGPSSLPVTINSTIAANRLFTHASVNLVSNTTGAGTLAINSSGSQISGAFTMSGGALSGTGTVDFLTLLTLQGGSLSGAGLLNASSGIRLAPPVNLTLNKPVDASGNSSWETGTVFNNSVASLQAAFRNLGTLTITNGVEWYDTPFTNLGTLTKSGSGVSRFVGGSFGNSGAVTVTSGTLRLDNSITSGLNGTFTVNSGGVLRLQNGASFNSASTVSGDGVLEAQQGTVDFNSGSSLSISQLLASNSGGFRVQAGALVSGNPNITLNGGSFRNLAPGANFGSLSANAGFLELQASATFNGNLTLDVSGSNNSFMTGPGSLTVTGSLTFPRGSWASSAGQVNVQGGLRLISDGGKDLQRSITMSGPSVWSGGLVTSAGTITQNGTLTVSANANWQSASRFQNNGTLIVESGAGVSRFTMMDFVNAGTVSVNSGTLRIDQTNDTGHSGSFFISPGATLQMQDVVQFQGGSSVQGAGTLSVDSGSLFFQSGSSFSAANVRLTNGSVNLQSGVTVTGPVNFTLQNSSSLTFGHPGLTVTSITSPLTGTTTSTITVQANAIVSGSVSHQGTLQGPGDLTVNGPMTYSGGAMLAGGSLIANGGLDFISTTPKDIRRSIQFGGASSWSGGDIFSAGTATFTQNGTMNVSASANWQSGALFQNNGVLNASPAGVSRFTIMDFANAGVVNVNGGTLRLDQATNTGHTGEFNVASGAVLQMQDTVNFQSGARVQGAGSLVSESGNLIFRPGSTLGVPNVNLTLAALTLEAGSSVTGPLNLSLQNNASATLGIPGLTVTSINSPLSSSAGSTLNLQANTTVTGGINFGGIITGPGDLTVNGLMAYAGGVFEPGGTLRANGGLNLTSTGTKDLRRNIVFGSTSVWDGGDAFGATTATFTNAGTFRMAGDLTWSSGNWVNNGLIQKSAGSGVGSFSLGAGSLNNNGTVSVTSGTLEIAAGGNHAGRFETSPNTQLTFRNGASFGAGTLLTGPGKFTITNGIFQFNSGANINSWLDANSATVNVNMGVVLSPLARLHATSSDFTMTTGMPATLQELRVENSNFSSGNALTVTSQSVFTGGRLRGAGSYDFQAGLNINGPLLKFIESNIRLGGTSNWTEGSVSALVNNLIQSEGTFIVNGGVQWSGSVFNNKGVFRKLGSGVTRMTTTAAGVSFGGAQFSNTGSVLVEGGTLVLGGFGVHNGSFTTSPGATLVFDGGNTFHSGATVGGSGVGRFDSGINNFNAGSTFSGQFAMRGGTVHFNAGSNPNLSPTLSMTQGGQVNFNSGATETFTQVELNQSSIGGSDPINVTGSMVMTGGTLTGSGTLTITSSGNLNLTGPNAKNLFKPIVANGPTSFSQGMVMASGGSFTNNGACTLGDGLSWFLGTFRNNGVLTKSAGNGTTQFHTAELINTGTISSTSGAISLVNLGALNKTSRALTGSGTYQVDNTGVIRFDDISTGIVSNAARLEMSGPNSEFLDGSGSNALRTLASNSGTITLNKGADLGLSTALLNTGQLRLIASDSTLTMGAPLTQAGGETRVDGALIAPSVNITGGRLVGEGAVQANVVNTSGELNAGAGVGMLTLNGSYQQLVGGKLRVEIQGPNSGDADQVLINGSATLGGELIVDAPSMIFIPSGTRYRVLTTTGNRTGTFLTVPPSSSWAIEYGPNFVDIVRAGNSMAVTVSGTLRLEPWTPANGVPPVTIELRQGANTQMATVTPAANGTWTYSFQTDFQGPVTITADRSGFLRRRVETTITSGGAQNVNFILPGGDVDDSGEIDLTDIDLVISAYLTTPSDPGYVLNADVDNSGEVDLTDVDIVISHYLQSDQ